MSSIVSDGERMVQSHITSGTKTKCKGDTEQQIPPPLMGKKHLLPSFCVTDLFLLTTHKSR